MRILEGGMCESLWTPAACSGVHVVIFTRSHQIALYDAYMYSPAAYMGFNFPKFLLTLRDPTLLSIFQSDEYEIISHCFNLHFPDLPETLSIISYVIEYLIFLFFLIISSYLLCVFQPFLPPPLFFGLFPIDFQNS